jgi:hypothetical protein
MNGEWTADAIEERRWLRSLVRRKRMSADEEEAQRVHHLGSDGKGCLHRKLKPAERLPRAQRKHRNVTVLPRMAGAPAQQEINEPTSK